jgi:bifunctional non-homologous end joining protein LigD
MPTQAPEYGAELSPCVHLPPVDPVSPAVRVDPFDHPDWVFEPKYDGIRAFVYAANGTAELRSRQDLRLDGLDELRERIAGVLGEREVILDGEIVSLDRQGKPSFRDLIRGEGFLAFAAFDLLWLNGRDLRQLPLDDRKRKLAGLLPEDTGPLYKILTLDECGRALFSAIRKMDLAGVVAKRRDQPYGPGATWFHIANPVYAQGDARMHLLRRRERSRAGR